MAGEGWVNWLRAQGGFLLQVESKLLSAFLRAGWEIRAAGMSSVWFGFSCTRHKVSVGNAFVSNCIRGWQLMHVMSVYRSGAHGPVRQNHVEDRELLEHQQAGAEEPDFRCRQL